MPNTHLLLSGHCAFEECFSTSSKSLQRSVLFSLSSYFDFELPEDRDYFVNFIFKTPRHVQDHHRPSASVWSMIDGWRMNRWGEEGWRDEGNERMGRGKDEGMDGWVGEWMVAGRAGAGMRRWKSGSWVNGWTKYNQMDYILWQIIFIFSNCFH